MEQPMGPNGPQTNLSMIFHQFRHENDFDFFFHLKFAEWNTEAGAAGAAGAPEMRPRAAARSLVPRAEGQDYVSS